MLAVRLIAPNRVRLCRDAHSGLSSLSISALASAVAFSMASFRVMVLGFNRRESKHPMRAAFRIGF